MEEKDVKLYKDIFYYINEDGKTLTIVGFKNSTKVAEVPDTIEDMKVTRMTAEFPTYRCTSLKEITISSGITLERRLFALNHSIEKVFLKSGVTLCGQVFEYSDLKEIKMEKGVKINDIPTLFRVERNKKYYGNFLFNSYPISKNPNAPRIWKECFEENLKRSDLLDKEGYEFQDIENRSIFTGCEFLTEIEIPEGIEILPNATFYACTSLCRVILPKTLKVIGALCFANCNNLVNIVIPEGVVAIGEDAFGGCTNLETVVLPSTLTHIVGNPFTKCKSLKRIVVPEGMLGLDGSEELIDEIFRYVSTFTVGYTSFNKKDFYSKKTWKQIFKSKLVSLITTKKISEKELKEKEDLAIKKLKEQGEFDKIKIYVDEFMEYFLENLCSSNYKKKDISLLKKKIITYIDSLQKISKNNYSNEEMILKEVKELVDYINEFNKKFQAIETEDREEICEIIDRCAILAGYPYPNPQIQSDFDITYEWRKW
ncbi:hypothetical protein RO03_10100 [Fusobacterium nucleatum subsp. nucleatum]|uniref:Leucine-rich repeat domain-containing protein n=1 Tax=Fusobacterium nucleatum subsp. nucleatum TaxID=76856 RepID=A0A101K591_FUSNC|nr:leucine-rich repeat domain-containing protein [Fusobacterium nucleatum]ALF23584.1 hypothetical protein RO05_04065 [Fusobacterium nucleatum subsp. nucleatum ChDC F316]ASG27046.1 hypothetical protein RN84_09830 [Fusobacterium nucleatum subsp. nucleatum]KUL97765.1 hypothetical protein RO03_10100 [Fusobacterium nucleatum subsp. nucleatum]